MSDSSVYVIVAGFVSQLIQSWMGFKKLEEQVANNYIPVAVYAAKTRELHDEINSLKLKVAVLEERHK